MDFWSCDVIKVEDFGVASELGLSGHPKKLHKHKGILEFHLRLKTRGIQKRCCLGSICGCRLFETHRAGGLWLGSTPVWACKLL